MTSYADHEDGLRAWAAGLNPLAAATELLIRTGFAGPEQPWVHYDEVAKRPWIGFDEIPELIAGMSGGERRLLQIAASIGGSTPIILGDELAGLDSGVVQLVTIAVVHAAGYSQSTSDVVYQDGQPRIIPVPPIAEWPSPEPW